MRFEEFYCVAKFPSIKILNISNQENVAPVYFQSLSLDYCKLEAGSVDVDGVFWMLFCEKM